MDSGDELLSFADDEPGPAPQEPGARPWRVLIIDDDPDVHDSTEFALRGLTILDRPLEFLHAFSAAEALAFLRQDGDVAAILLDVVMETDDAGLRVVEAIRNELGLTDVRIILRTGQPGYAPEMEAISRYEINDYKTKSELTRIKLYTSLTAAIRSYDQLRRLNASHSGLKRILDASHSLIAAGGLGEFATGVITQIAGFFGIEPEGLVCLRAPSEGASTLDGIIGGAGRHAHLAAQPLAQLGETRIRQLIERCLNERGTLREEPGLALFCPGQSGHDIAAYLESSRPPHDADHNLLELLCANIGLCGDNISLISRLWEAATCDSLVHLPNRMAFIEAIDKVLKEGGDSDRVLVLLDIDRFAEINDVLGSRYGDLLLQAIAQRLREQLPPSALIARVAGDRFGVFGAGDIVYPQLLRALFHTPLVIEGIESLVSFTMGLVRVWDCRSSGAELFQCASIARKRAKAGGQIGQTAHYTQAMSDEIRHSATLLHEMRLALQRERQQFYLVYQPQIDLESGKVVGLEALIRWKKQDGALVPPDRFIPIAEQSGLVVTLGNWVLRTALSGLNRLRTEGYDEICMAVNVSAVQFCHPDFISSVDQCLSESGVPPERLELEITESAAVMGLEFMQNILRELKTRGITIAIDDFGTGYSSLSYLDRLPADRLKIDRSFVMLIGTDQPGVRITDMVIPLGRQLGMKVLAEGVEDAAQVARLRQLGCDEIQGYYTGRPMELDALLDWLAQHGGTLSLPS